jgi:hypothetical protein
MRHECHSTHVSQGIGIPPSTRHPRHDRSCPPRMFDVTRIGPDRGLKHATCIMSVTARSQGIGLPPSTRHPRHERSCPPRMFDVSQISPGRGLKHASCVMGVTAHSQRIGLPPSTRHPRHDRSCPPWIGPDRGLLRNAILSQADLSRIGPSRGP